MTYNKLETLVGLIVLIIATCFFSFAYKIYHRGDSKTGYSIIATFQNIDGIEAGSDVKISGIKIGAVDQILLREDSYDAVLTLKINNSIQIPKDSTAMVATNGFIGNKYIRIVPGAAEENLNNGQKITLTQSSLNIEDLISKLLYNMTNKWTL